MCVICNPEEPLPHKAKRGHFQLCIMAVLWCIPIRLVVILDQDGTFLKLSAFLHLLAITGGFRGRYAYCRTNDQGLFINHLIV